MELPPGTNARDVDLPTGIRLRVYERGEGPAVLFLHGFPELALSWRHQFEALSDRYRLVAPDMPGYGGSDAPRWWWSYTQKKLAAHVAALAASLDAGPVHLVGHDWGGAIAWLTAAWHPTRVRSLAVLNCPHPRLMARRMLTSADQFRRSWYIFAFQLPYLPERRFKADPSRLARGVFRGSAANKAAFPDEVLAPYAAEFARTGMRGPLHYYRAAMRIPLGRVPKIKAPSLLIWGAQDKALQTELSEIGQYAGLVEDLEVRRIPESGHWVQQEAPQAVNSALDAHWRANG